MAEEYERFPEIGGQVERDVEAYIRGMGLGGFYHPRGDNPKAIEFTYPGAGWNLEGDDQKGYLVPKDVEEMLRYRSRIERAIAGGHVSPEQLHRLVGIGAANSLDIDEKLLDEHGLGGMAMDRVGLAPPGSPQDYQNRAAGAAWKAFQESPGREGKPDLGAGELGDLGPDARLAAVLHRANMQEEATQAQAPRSLNPHPGGYTRAMGDPGESPVLRPKYTPGDVIIEPQTPEPRGYVTKGSKAPPRKEREEQDPVYRRVSSWHEGPRGSALEGERPEEEGAFLPRSRLGITRETPLPGGAPARTLSDALHKRSIDNPYGGVPKAPVWHEKK